MGDDDDFFVLESQPAGGLRNIDGEEGANRTTVFERILLRVHLRH